MQTIFEINFPPGRSPMHDPELRYRDVIGHEPWAEIVDAPAESVTASSVPVEEMTVESIGPPVEDPDTKHEASEAVEVAEATPPRRKRGRRARRIGERSR